MSTFSERVALLGLDAITAPDPVGAYRPAVVSGDLLYTAGQLPLVDGTLSLTGKVGAEITPEAAKHLARRCALNGLAAAQAVLGSLERISQVVRVGGFVASAPDFTGQAGVLDGASELLGDLFDDTGRHVRSAVGVAVLPLDAPVEVEMVFEFR